MFNSEILMVLSAAVLNFILNSLWFTLVKNVKGIRSEEERRDPIPYLISFIGSLWASYGLFLIIKHITPNSISELLGIAIAAWICILIALSAKHYSYAKLSLREFSKDYLVDLVGLIIMSFVIWKGM